MPRPPIRFSDRRAIEAEVRTTRATIGKMERALDEKYEYLRKLEEELEHAHGQSAHQARTSAPEA
jgi:hypothetical protein